MSKETDKKTRLGFTIDKELAKEFKELAKKHYINMSAYMEKCINEFVKEYKIK